MTWRRVRALPVLLAALVGLQLEAASAATPSFDCAAARAPIETLICGNDDLARADADLAALYGRLMGALAGGARADLLRQQRLWLESRFASCDIPRARSTTPAGAKAAACLLTLYRDRIAALASPAAAGSASALEPGKLPATGTQAALLSIAAFGRYSISVRSAQGVGLQLVDRMTGPGEVQGGAGESDGRIDAFLDRGQYKLLAYASDQGSGDAVLSLHPFAELNGPSIPRLPELRRVDTALEDFQQRSYWLEIAERRVVAIEAAGRNLADLRLWRDGSWLVDAAPSADRIEPLPGKPLAVRRIVTTLEPGLYLLSAYGGPGETWATSSAEHPLHLRMGIPTLADAGRAAFVASPFGIDRYLVPGSANFFRLELPEAEAAALSVGDYSEAQPFGQGASTTITKQSLPPVAEISDAGAKGYRLLTITREAGKPYVLQHFQSVSEYPFDGAGDYWIGTLHSGAGEDVIDATGLLTRRAANQPEEIVQSNGPTLDAKAAWSRRFNLLGEATAYVHVTETGRYVVTGSGAEADYRFEPMIDPGNGYKAPEFQPSGAQWALEPGYYQLTIRPRNEGKGILAVRVAAQGATGEGGDRAKQTAVLFPEVHLSGDSRYTLYVNQQPGVRAGVVLRRLPIDLRPGLPVTLAARQSLDIPVTAPADGVVTATAEDGRPLRFVIDRHAPAAEWRGGNGRHVLTLANPTDQAVSVALRFTPDALAPATPLPALSPEAQQALPRFPALVPRQPRYFDIDQGEHRTFALDVAEPGLYRVESSGLLQTEGAMRTRTVVSLDSAAGNGTGRNFLLQQYLGQGSYQLTVAAQGETHGHMGVAATRTVLTDGGALSPGIAARDTMAAGNGLLFRFTISAAGRYRLQALGLGRSFRMRLEDQDGWPIETPNGPADLTRIFEPGTYRLVILPQPVDARIVTLLEPLPDPVPVEGHGPHELALDHLQAYRWEEPAAGGPRTPDQWRFHLPAPAHLAIDLGRGMVADLVAEPDGRIRDRVEGGETWKGELPAGTYLLRATSREPDNRFDYSLQVAATELLAGESRVTKLPADIPISLGGDAVAEIASFGTTDVRASLYDQANRLVARNDDRPNDWNFAIAGRMRPGYYRLHVEAVGSVPAGDHGGDEADADQSGDAAEPAPPPAEPAGTTIAIHQAEEQLEPPLAAGDATLAGPKVHVVPLALAAGAVLVASADGQGPAVGLAVEVAENGTWRTLAESTARTPWIAVPVAGMAGPYRLQVWSADRSPLPIRLQTRRVEPQPVPAASLLAAGVPLRPVPGIEPPLGLGAVDLAAPGAFQLRQMPPDLAWSTANGRALAGDAAGILFGDHGRLWLGARLQGGGDTVVAAPIIPAEDAVALSVPGSDHGAAIIADPTDAQGSPQLWLLESRLGQPGIGGDGLASATAMGEAIAVAPAAARPGQALRLWNAGDPAMPLPVTLRRFGFAPPARETLGWGVADRRIAGRQALAFALPAGRKRLHLALPPATAVLLQGADDEAIWSGRAPLALGLDSGADRILVLSTATTDAQLGLALAPLAGGAGLPDLGGGGIFTQSFAAAGVIRLAVRLSASERASGGALRLRLAGAVLGATLTRDDGTVSRDAAPSVGGNAVVDIAHGPGLVAGWIEGGDPLTAPGVAAPATAVRATSVVALSGVAAPATAVRATSVVALSGAARQLDFPTDAPKLLHLKTSVPVLAQVSPTAVAAGLRLFADGADLNLLLPRGVTRSVVLRAAGGGDLAGVAEATLMDIAPIGEGLGPRVRLAPGESRLYSFTLADERDIGVGVRGSPDTAHCRVLDADGAEIGAGVAQMLRLKAGTYLLAVDAPADGTAIEIQPALVGIAAPDGSPPDEVKRGYRALAGLESQQPAP
jgi:uncharacterized protein YecT (DUF1311 family)